MSPTPSGVAVALGLLTARWPAGTRDVAAQRAGRCKVPPAVHVDEPRRRSGYLFRCGTGSWPKSMPGNRSGRCFVIWG